MMRTIEKKTWPEYFRSIKAHQKSIELRLADFKISKGDILLLREWDLKRKTYTGRSIKRKVKGLTKMKPLKGNWKDISFQLNGNSFFMTKFYPVKELKKYGIYIIEL